jgi:hypothetical protein
LIRLDEITLQLCCISLQRLQQDESADERADPYRTSQGRYPTGLSNLDGVSIIRFPDQGTEIYLVVAKGSLQQINKYRINTMRALSKRAGECNGSHADINLSRYMHHTHTHIHTHTHTHTRVSRCPWRDKLASAASDPFTQGHRRRNGYIPQLRSHGEDFTSCYHQAKWYFEWIPIKKVTVLSGLAINNRAMKSRATEYLCSRQISNVHTSVNYAKHYRHRISLARASAEINSAVEFNIVSFTFLILFITRTLF